MRNRMVRLTIASLLLINISDFSHAEPETNQELELFFEESLARIDSKLKACINSTSVPENFFQELSTSLGFFVEPKSFEIKNENSVPLTIRLSIEALYYQKMDEP